MQSSSTVTLRAMVMLVCLIAVPLVAVSRTSLPKLLTDTIGGRKPNRPAPTPAPMADAIPRGGEAPPFSPTVRLPEREGAAAEESHGPPVAANRVQETRAATPGAAVAGAPLWGPAAPPTGTAPAQSQPTNFEASEDRAATGSPAASHRPRPPAGTNQPSYPQARPPQAGTSVGQGDRVDSGERFTQIQRRLRDLGATYYLLETWGDRGDQFRFHCKMPVAGNPNYTRPFEATHRDPIAAMQKVLEQIEAWRGGS
jgi:hypothetical protein